MRNWRTSITITPSGSILTTESPCRKVLRVHLAYPQTMKKPFRSFPERTEGAFFDLFSTWNFNRHHIHNQRCPLPLCRSYSRTVPAPSLRKDEAHPKQRARLRWIVSNFHGNSTHTGIPFIMHQNVLPPQGSPHRTVQCPPGARWIESERVK